MKAIILHQRIIHNDAIGNDIVNMYHVLNGIGYEVHILCDILTINNLRCSDRIQLKSIIADRNNLIVYHHSQYWKEGEEILSEAKARILIKYHKITPEHPLKEVNQHSVIEFKLCHEMTERLIRDHKDAYWIADSTYNLQDIGAVEEDHKMVVPPFTNIDRWKSITPDVAILKRLLESSDINILFIGSLLPNKGQKFILEVLQDYVVHYGKRIVLHVIVKIDQQNNYTHELADTITRLGMAKHFRFTGGVNEQTLLAYYLGCDIYLSGSEFYGFCAPIVEAQFCYLPVVARNTSAVAETLGPNQVLLAEDVREYSSAIHLICSTTAYRDFIAEAGYNNYQTRFTNSIIADRFKNMVSQATGAYI
jgi:glycosyltransferase involved in cell wall biosynthesis